MKKGLLIFCAFFLTAGTLAWAGEASSWGGFYLGAAAGFGRHEPNWSDTDFDWYGGTLTNPYFTILPGMTLGFNIQFGSLVIGFEADGSMGFKKNEVLYELRHSGPDHDVTKTDKLKMMFTARGRMGVVIDQTMIYMTAGAGMPIASHSWIEYQDENDSWEELNNAVLGMVVGLGFEQRIGSAFSAKAEFLCFKSSPKGHPNAEDPPYYMYIDETVEILRLGFNFKF